MDNEQFEELAKSVEQARRYARGELVPGVRVHAQADLDIAALRRRVGLSQSAFSRQIGVSVATLRNWEQGRRRPEGPARVLLAMIERDPNVVARTLLSA